MNKKSYSGKMSLPQDIQNMVLSYRPYVERNRSIFLNLLDIFSPYKLDYNAANKVRIDLNKLLSSYPRVHSYYEIEGEDLEYGTLDYHPEEEEFIPVAVIDEDDSFPDSFIVKLLTYFFSVKTDQGPIFYDSEKLEDIVDETNKLLEHFDSDIRVELDYDAGPSPIPYVTIPSE